MTHEKYMCVHTLACMHTCTDAYKHRQAQKDIKTHRDIHIRTHTCTHAHTCTPTAANCVVPKHNLPAVRELVTCKCASLGRALSLRYWEVNLADEVSTQTNHLVKLQRESSRGEQGKHCTHGTYCEEGVLQRETLLYKSEPCG